MMIKLIIFLFPLILFAQEKHEFNPGDVVDKDLVEENFNYHKKPTPKFGYVPIGTIIAYHQNFKNHLDTNGVEDALNSNDNTDQLTLPLGWVECDGNSYSVDQNGVLDPDGDGLYTVPDLNTPVYADKKGRYLRGGILSGKFNPSTAWDDNGSLYTASGNGRYYGAAFARFNDLETSANKSTYSGSPLNPDQFRFQVESMTVKYIMRIK